MISRNETMQHPVSQCCTQNFRNISFYERHRGFAKPPGLHSVNHICILYCTVFIGYHENGFFLFVGHFPECVENRRPVSACRFCAGLSRFNSRRVCTVAESEDGGENKQRFYAECLPDPSAEEGDQDGNQMVD